MATERLRLLIADDEPLARSLLRTYLERLNAGEIVGECADADALGDALLRLQPDVLLLDVQMPGRDVFDVLADVISSGRALPAIIFTTAFDRYAVRAFEVNAADYVLKPFTQERLECALSRVCARRAAGHPSDLLSHLIRDLGPQPERLLVPDGERMVPVAVADIRWIKAEGDYVRLHVRGRSYLVARTLTELEARLDPRQFLRVHRSAIVRGDHIQEVRPEGSQRYRVVLDDGTILIVSRSRAPRLRSWML